MPASPAVQPPPGNPRFPMVEAMRGIAVALVLFCHASQMSGAALHSSWGWLGTYAYFGVILFFVISGFLLYRPFVMAHAGLGRAPRVRTYWRRRLLRILPAYWVALTVLALWPGIEGPLTHQWWIYYGFMQVYGVHTLTMGLAPAWSLCVEMTFYLVLPLLAAITTLLARRLVGRSWWQAEIAVLVAFGSIGVVGQVLVHDHRVPYWVANTLGGTSDWFVGGMGLAVVSVAAQHGSLAARCARVVERWSTSVWVLGVLTFLLAARVFDVRTVTAGRPGVYTVTLTAWVANHVGFGLAATLLLAPTVLGARGPVARVASWRPLAALGLVSYGVYLWHYPLEAWLGLRGAYPRLHGGGLDIVNHVSQPTIVLMLSTLLVAATVATVSYRFVELPFLRRKEPSSAGMKPTRNASLRSR